MIPIIILAIMYTLSVLLGVATFFLIKSEEDYGGGCVFMLVITVVLSGCSIQSNFNFVNEISNTKYDEIFEKYPKHIVKPYLDDGKITGFEEFYIVQDSLKEKQKKENVEKMNKLLNYINEE